jgi:hypothetical protein
MGDELKQILQAYLEGRATRRDLRLLTVEFDWDDTSPETLRLQPTIGRLDLLLEEVGEGLRSESELRQFAESQLTDRDLWIRTA